MHSNGIPGELGKANVDLTVSMSHGRLCLPQECSLHHRGDTKDTESPSAGLCFAVGRQEKSHDSGKILCPVWGCPQGPRDNSETDRKSLAPPFPLGRALIPSKSQVSCSLLFSSQKKDNPQHQFSSSAQGSSGKQKMGGTELLWAPKWKQNPDTFAWEHFCRLWSSRNASPWTRVVSLRVCDEMCGTGRGSLAKPSEGLAKASSPPSCYHRESQRQVLGSSSGLSLLQEALEWGRSSRARELQKCRALAAPRPGPAGHTAVQEETPPEKPPKGGKGSDDAPSSQELNNGARRAEHSFAWPGDPILSHQPHSWDTAPSPRGGTRAAPTLEHPDSVCLHSVFQAL